MERDISVPQEIWGANVRKVVSDPHAGGVTSASCVGCLHVCMVLLWIVECRFELSAKPHDVISFLEKLSSSKRSFQPKNMSSTEARMKIYVEKILNTWVSLVT